MYVEFLGVPRQRAGVAELVVEAGTLGQLLETLSDRLPSLSDLIVGNRLQSSFVANLNGDEFISDPGTPLRRRRLRPDPVSGRGWLTEMQDSKCKMHTGRERRHNELIAAPTAAGLHFEFCILHYS
jgi:molybdopterin converting factor small subunit